MNPGVWVLLTYVAGPVLADGDFYRVESRDGTTTPLRALWHLVPGPLGPRLVLAS